MSAGITRIHGKALPESFYGYQPRWFEIMGNYTNTNVGGSFEQAVRTIESVATLVILGQPDNSSFVVAVDGATFAGRGDYSGYGSEGTNAAATLADLLDTTVNEVSLYGNNFND
jgi:hypothetical protein